MTGFDLLLFLRAIGMVCQNWCQANLDKQVPYRLRLPAAVAAMTGFDDLMTWDPSVYNRDIIYNDVDKIAAVL